MQEGTTLKRKLINCRLPKRAEWYLLYEGTYRCTNCGKGLHVPENDDGSLAFNYCPFCGSKMIGVNI